MAQAIKTFVARHRRKLFGLAAAIAVYAVLGFFVAPWLVKKNAIEIVDSMYGADLRIQKVAVNPFVLSLRIDGLEMDDPAGAPFFRLEQFFANLQLSSIINRGPTFAEIRFDSPEMYFSRDVDGEMNLAFLLGSDEQPTGNNAATESAMPRIVLQQFLVNDASTHWHDEVPVDPVTTVFGPVNVRVNDLSTLPQEEGEQDVVITTETAGTFRWNGSLQLNPLRSVGRASVDGSHFPLVSAYIRDSSGFEVVRGEAGIGFDYSIDTRDDGELEVRVDNLDLAFADVSLRTYGLTASDGSSADRSVIDIPTFRVAGGMVRYPEQQASIGRISVEDSTLEIYRDENGELAAFSRGSSTEEVAAAEEPAAAPAPWSVAIEQIDVLRTSIELVDDSVTPTAELGVSNLNLSVSGIDNAPGTRFDTRLALDTRGGGSVRVQGEVGALPTANADIELSVAGISLALVHPYLRGLADVNLDSGSFGMEVNVHTSAEEVLAVSGNAAVKDFLITETDAGSRLGSWDLLAANDIELSLTEETLDISEVVLEQPYGDVLIAEDGSINLGRVAPGDQSVAEDETDGQEVAQEDAAEEALPLAITIGRVLVNNGAADFEDRSLPLPFDVNIAELNGQLTTIASESTEPSVAEFEGKVDEFGLMQVSGFVTPLQPALNTDLKLRFENVEMPKFSAYSVPFAGREIASGKLDLNLGYKVENSELVGENKVVLRDFELGDKVDHPGASSLPLGLAVALLKNPDGTIDIDLPVRGNVDDPEFRYGRVIGKALVNLVVKIAASPFALLGKLVGAEADELEYIAFQDGRSDLTPPEQEKAIKLAEALRLRPELTMEIDGVVDREADGFAIRAMRLDEAIEQQIATDGNDDQYAEKRLDVLESMFGAGEQRDLLEQQFETEEGLDELAYATELRRQLIEASVLDEADFVALAQSRAANVQAAIVALDAGLQQQILVGQLEEVDKGSDPDVRMQIVLSAAGGDGE